MKHLLLFLFLTCTSFIFFAPEGLAMGKTNQASPSCDHLPRLSGKRIDCEYPVPPAGRWKAVYSPEFAQKHNLPPEDISTDLSPGVDYMEMETIPIISNKRTTCMINMLVKKPHDISLFSTDRLPVPVPKDRKLLHLIDINNQREKQVTITTFSSSSRDYIPDKKGFMGTTLATYIEDALPGYDYFSLDYNCRKVLLNTRWHFPDGYGIRIIKASIAGRHKRNLNQERAHPKKLKGEAQNAHYLMINVPQELILNIFKDIPMKGK